MGKKATGSSEALSSVAVPLPPPLRLFTLLGTDPFSAGFRARVLRHVALATALAAFVAGLGAAVRLLPLALDPALPAAAFAPFARSLFALAIEVSLLLGISGGVASSLFALGDRGDGRALAALGERPLRTVARTGPALVPFVLLLGGASYLFGRDAGAPGRVLGEIITRGEQHCLATERSGPPNTVVLPFVPLVWLCAPGQTPRLAGRTPVGAVPLTARNIHLSGDLARISLDDSRLLFDGGPGATSGPLQLHAQQFSIAGLPPWGRALVLPASARALLLPVVALLGVVLVGRRLVLRPLEGAYGRVVAIVVGLLPPLGAFGSLQALERTGAGANAFLVVVPAVAFLLAATPLEALPALVQRLRDARNRRRADGPVANGKVQ